MSDLQTWMDGMSVQWQKERAATQLTLGEMIDFLKTLPSDVEIVGLGELNSYRGYYSDLAFEPTMTKRKVEELLEACQSAMGQVFEGYKGGDFMMGALTPLWVAAYGNCGNKLLAINSHGTLQLGVDDDY